MALLNFVLLLLYYKNYFTLLSASVHAS